MSIRSERGRSSEHRGRFAEKLAEAVLRIKGYRILARRMRNAAGEIDLIAQNLSGVVCFVEVKTRPDTGKAVAAVSAPQRARISRAAEIYLAGRQDVRGARFDVICLVPNRLPRHIRDAWRPDEP
jgi:putative endonuclease